MFSNTNAWKRIKYTLWAAVYDLLVKPLFGRKRRRSIEPLDLKAGERVLLVGAGTGLDLDFLPRGFLLRCRHNVPDLVHREPIPLA